MTICLSMFLTESHFGDFKTEMFCHRNVVLSSNQHFVESAPRTTFGESFGYQ